jgi:hypothetical protein
MKTPEGLNTPSPLLIKIIKKDISDQQEALKCNKRILFPVWA